MHFLLLVDHNDGPRRWHLNSLSLYIVHFFMFWVGMGEYIPLYNGCGKHGWECGWSCFVHLQNKFGIVFSNSYFSKEPPICIPTFFLNLKEPLVWSQDFKHFKSPLGLVSGPIPHVSRLLLPYS